MGAVPAYGAQLSENEIAALAACVVRPLQGDASSPAGPQADNKRLFPKATHWVAVSSGAAARLASAELSVPAKSLAIGDKSLPSSAFS